MYTPAPIGSKVSLPLTKLPEAEARLATACLLVLMAAGVACVGFGGDRRLAGTGGQHQGEDHRQAGCGMAVHNLFSWW